MRHKDSARSYYTELEKFLHLGNDLIDQGYPYLTVLLCHELYRFLYPYEPYADFRTKNPVPFITQHIQTLIRQGREFAAAVVPYPNVLSSFTEQSGSKIPLGKKTSDVYTSLWKGFDRTALAKESLKLLRNRLPTQTIQKDIRNKHVLDMGCGSGRYSIALARVGAKRVTAIDWQKASFQAAQAWAKKHDLPIRFREGSVLRLPFRDNTFDFIFCNGVLHHTQSLEKGLQELHRVLKKGGRSFLYLYGSGGIFWSTRRALRTLFKRIPLEYTKQVLQLIGMPGNRFIFCDTWYVPVEGHTTTPKLHSMLDRLGFSYSKVIGHASFDLDKALTENIRHGDSMWGDGEHRYLLQK